MIFAPLLLAVAIVPAGNTFDCTPIAVWDGDGPVWCAEGPRLRLAGIAAREIDGSCRDNQPCPAADAVQARDALAGLLGKRVGMSSDGHVLIEGRTLRCTSTGPAVGTRTGAWCTTADGIDVSCWMVRHRWALEWDRYWRGHRC